MTLTVASSKTLLCEKEDWKEEEKNTNTKPRTFFCYDITIPFSSKMKQACC